MNHNHLGGIDVLREPGERLNARLARIGQDKLEPTDSALLQQTQDLSPGISLMCLGEVKERWRSTGYQLRRENLRK